MIIIVVVLGIVASKIIADRILVGIDKLGEKEPQ